MKYQKVYKCLRCNNVLVSPKIFYHTDMMFDTYNSKESTVLHQCQSQNESIYGVATLIGWNKIIDRSLDSFKQQLPTKPQPQVSEENYDINLDPWIKKIKNWVLNIFNKESLK